MTSPFIQINKSGLDLTGNSQRCKPMPIRQFSSFFQNIEALSSNMKIHSILYCKDYRHFISTGPWLPDLTSVPPGLAFSCHLKFGKLFLGPLDQISGGSRISPRWGCQLSRGHANIRFCQIFPKNYLKLKEFGPRGARPPRPPFDPPLQIPHQLENIFN